MPSFTPNIPTSSQTLGQTQQPIQDNFTTINTTIAVDHVAMNSANQGYHTIIHQGPQGSDPGAIAGIGQLYVKTTGAGKPGQSDQQLFYESGAGGISQMSGDDISNPGGAYLSGVLFQWGTASVNSAGSLTTISYKYSFSSAPVNIQITGVQSTNTSSPSANNVYIVPGSITTTTFQVSNSSSGTLNSIHWLAIGKG